MKRYEKALEFFEKNSLEVNLDGLFGLRVSQGKFIFQVILIFKLINILTSYIYFEFYFILKL